MCEGACPLRCTADSGRREKRGLALEGRLPCEEIDELDSDPYDDDEIESRESLSSLV